MNTITSETTVIKLSRRKIVFMFIGSALLIIIGIWMILKHQEIKSPLNSTLAILLVGIASVLFFGFAAITAIRKMTTQSDGLVISAKGITDSSSGISAGFIPWEEIITITETSIANQIFINIMVKNPEEFIASQKSSFKRKAMMANHKSFGTSIAISANNLKITHENLKKILVEKLTEYNRIHNL